jgi:formate hydrogenlyase subunit 3/multisubunit Na+/H+ antiporter MnhD subunit
MPDPIEPPWRTVLLALGAVFLAAGLLWPWISRYFGRLPGDIVVRRDGWTFAFPIVTSLVVSVLLSLLLWLLRK